MRISWLRIGASLVAATTLAVLGLSCGETNSSVLTACEVYAGECGQPCAKDTECAEGLFCDEQGTCFAECSPGGGQCGDDQVCNAEGRCVSGFLTSGAGGSNSCGNVEVSFAPQTPSVVLLVDQSGSMNENFDGSARWDVVYDALMDPNGGVVQSLEGVVRFGLVLYTNDEDSGTCPDLIEVMPPALNNFAAIDAIYAQEQPEADTPTGESLQPVADALAAFSEPGPQVIILATDGEPDTCAVPDPQNGQPEAIAAAQYAFGLGIQTVIIAVGNQVSQTHQQDMANAGKGLPVPAPDPCNDPVLCAPTFEPATKQDMIDTFLDIVNGVRTCVFTLDGSVVDGRECDGVVTINGVSIPCNDPNGFRLNGPSVIEFLGDACDEIMNGDDPQIAASFPCDAIEGPK